MNKINELINELCPNGVEYKKIGDIFSVITDFTAAGSFADNAKNVKYIKTPDFAQLIRTTDIKSEFCDKNSFVYVDENAFNYLWRVNINEECIIMPNVGNCGEVYYINPQNLPNKNNVLGPNAILLKTKNYNLKFLYYCIDSNLFKYKLSKITSSTGQTKFNKTNLKELTLPVPPMEVQNEIVHILDDFTLLSAELSAELKAREKQYEFYKNQLYDFKDKEIKYVKLGEIAEIIRGGNFQKKDFVENGKPCIHYGQIYTKYGSSATKTISFVNEEIFKKSKIAQPNDIVMAVTSENIDDVCKCVVWLGNENIAVSGHTAIIHHNINAKYLGYYFSTLHFFKQKEKLAHGTKVIEVTPSSLNDIVLPLPSIEEQEKIANIIEKFDKLCNDISNGLPSEIKARQKQYEYYRDKLLTFKELKVEN